MLRNPENAEKGQGRARRWGPTLLKALRYRERRRDDHLVGVPKAGPLQRTAPPVPEEKRNAQESRNT